MLNGVLALHDIKDVEKFTAGILNEWLHGPRRLDPWRQESLHAYLIAAAYDLAQRYEQRPRRWSFSKYAHTILRRRITDWYREEYGDSRRDTDLKRNIRFPDHLTEAMGLPDPTTRAGHRPQAAAGARAPAHVLSLPVRLLHPSPPPEWRAGIRRHHPGR